MRDRLIGLIASKVCSRYLKDTCLSKWSGSCGECECGRNFQIGDVADYLLDNGVIAPPCKVGDTLYYPSFGTDRVLLYKVISIKLNSKGLYVVCENCLSKSQMTHRATQIGETIFLTEVEAERALAERKSDDE
jgi:hypothetical protein